MGASTHKASRPRSDAAHSCRLRARPNTFTSPARAFSTSLRCGRNPNAMDVFTVGSFGGVYSAWWNGRWLEWHADRSAGPSCVKALRAERRFMLQAPTQMGMNSDLCIAARKREARRARHRTRSLARYHAKLGEPSTSQLAQRPRTSYRKELGFTPKGGGRDSNRMPLNIARTPALHASPLRSVVKTRRIRASALDNSVETGLLELSALAGDSAAVPDFGAFCETVFVYLRADQRLSRTWPSSSSLSSL